MGLTQQDIDLIDAFLLGNLEAKALQNFEQRLKVDSVFAEEVERMKTIQLAVKQSSLEDKMKMLKLEEEKMAQAKERADLNGNGRVVENGKEESLISESPAQQSTNGKQLSEGAKVVGFPWRRVLSIAASVLVIGIVGIWWNQSNEKEEQSEALYVQYFDPPEIPIRIVRSTSWDNKQVAYAAFKDGRYDVAAPKLKEVWNNLQDTTALYYAALAYWGNKDIEKAKEIFELDFINDENFEKYLESIKSQE